jgi:hypothetical protein
MSLLNAEIQAIYARFWQATSAASDEAQTLKLKTIEYLLFNPGGQDFTKAAEMLSEIGF